MTDPRLDIVAANPNWFVIYESEKELFIGDPVIAWRIRTIFRPNKPEWETDSMYCYVDAILSDGDVASNCAGFLRPDGQADVNGTTYKSFEDAAKNYRNE